MDIISPKFTKDYFYVYKYCIKHFRGILEKLCDKLINVLPL